MIPAPLEVGLIACSLPLAWQDARTFEVSARGLVVFFLVCLGSTLALDAESTSLHVLGATAVLIVGILVWLGLPGRVGEADLLYGAALALVNPFWSFLAIMALACLAGLGLLVGSFRLRGVWHQPVPFIALMFWGWIVVFVANCLGAS